MQNKKALIFDSALKLCCSVLVLGGIYGSHSDNLPSLQWHQKWFEIDSTSWLSENDQTKEIREKYSGGIYRSIQSCGNVPRLIFSHEIISLVFYEETFSLDGIIFQSNGLGSSAMEGERFNT